MQVFTDSLRLAERLLQVAPRWRWCSEAERPGFLRPVLDRFFGEQRVAESDVAGWEGWGHLVVVEDAPESQFDALAALLEGGFRPPGPLLCVAGQGRGFHGFKQRPWAGVAGNIHLVACFRPECRLEQPGAGPTVVSTVSVLEALDRVPFLRGRARVKWVNDVLVEGAKVGGVLARTQTLGDRVDTLLLGIGLNVERTPEVARDLFVPRVGSVQAFAPPGTRVEVGRVFVHLAERLARNHERYLAGGYSALLETYRERSSVLGRRVRVLEDTARGMGKELCRGRVTAIGEGLELYLDGDSRPVVHGRLVLD